MDSTTFAARGEEQSPGESGWTLLTFILPIKGRKVVEGGPWRAFTMVTDVGVWDAFSPSSFTFGKPDFTIRLDDGAEIYAFPGMSCFGLGPFSKIELIDRRSSFFIALNVQLFLSNDEEHFLYQGRVG